MDRDQWEQFDSEVLGNDVRVAACPPCDTEDTCPGGCDAEDTCTECDACDTACDQGCEVCENDDTGCEEGCQDACEEGCQEACQGGACDIECEVDDV